MMIDGVAFRKKHENKSLQELIEVRNELIRSIMDYENNNIPEDEMYTKPSPKVKYDMHNEYLKEIVDLILIEIRK